MFRIEKIKKTDLDNLDMTELSLLIENDEDKLNFKNLSGKEHYRLLSFLSKNNFSSSFIDIGTFRGSSALAFSFNEKNIVHSFNIEDQLELIEKPKNIIFHIDDVMNSDHTEKLLSSKVILLDTFHDGIFESKFLNYLDEIKFKGVVIMDDIHYFGDLTRLWDSITKEKYDITEIGHWSGTGLIYYN